MYIILLFSLIWLRDRCWMRVVDIENLLWSNVITIFISSHDPVIVSAVVPITAEGRQLSQILTFLKLRKPGVQSRSLKFRTERNIEYGLWVEWCTHWFEWFKSDGVYNWFFLESYSCQQREQTLYKPNYETKKSSWFKSTQWPNISHSTIHIVII